MRSERRSREEERREEAVMGEKKMRMRYHWKGNGGEAEMMILTSTTIFLDANYFVLRRFFMFARCILKH